MRVPKEESRDEFPGEDDGCAKEIGIDDREDLVALEERLNIRTKTNLFGKSVKE